MNLKNIFIASFLLFVPFLTISASTFPEEDAGISAYVKLDDINSEILNEVNAFIGEEGIPIESSETHVVGKIPIEIIIEDDYHLSDIDINIYLDLDGWLVAYLPEGVDNIPSSYIIQWSNYSPNNMAPNMLEEAIEKISDEIGVGYSGSPDYYHFQYPNANRMTIIVDTVYIDVDGGEEQESFSVIVPGTINEASYSVYFSKAYDSPGAAECYWGLSVGDKTIDEETKDIEGDTVCQRLNRFVYGFYELSDFPSKTSNLVLFKAKTVSSSYSVRMGAATVLIYEVGVE